VDFSAPPVPNSAIMCVLRSDRRVSLGDQATMERGGHLPFYVEVQRNEVTNTYTSYTWLATSW